MAVSWYLEDGVARNKEFPSTFFIPKQWKKALVGQGDIVKLMFNISFTDDGKEACEIERMWVIVTEKSGDLYKGVLDNDPYCTSELKSGVSVEFEGRHIIAIEYERPWKKILAYV
ncbi:DUF2314 domain-containing protein [Catenovulum sp. SX2]|uniref:DUF2314 domain-containing protein n=1 Tax=Catenovulum sp. SX2 TaxID=3398614 RepID=UPI003F871E87